MRVGGGATSETSHGETDGDHAQAQAEQHDEVDAGERQRPAGGFTENACAASYWSDAGFVLAASADPEPRPKSANAASTGVVTASRCVA